MADDDCWAIRAQADALQSEVSTLRGAVAALRVARSRDTASPIAVARASALPLSFVAALAFGLGVVLTLVALLLFRAVFCG